MGSRFNSPSRDFRSPVACREAASYKGAQQAEEDRAEGMSGLLIQGEVDMLVPTRRRHRPRRDAPAKALPLVDLLRKREAVHVRRRSVGEYVVLSVVQEWRGQERPRARRHGLPES